MVTGSSPVVHKPVVFHPWGHRDFRTDNLTDMLTDALSDVCTDILSKVRTGALTDLRTDALSDVRTDAEARRPRHGRAGAPPSGKRIGTCGGARNLLSLFRLSLFCGSQSAGLSGFSHGHPNRCVYACRGAATQILSGRRSPRIGTPCASPAPQILLGLESGV